MTSRFDRQSPFGPQPVNTIKRYVTHLHRRELLRHLYTSPKNYELRIWNPELLTMYVSGSSHLSEENEGLILYEASSSLHHPYTTGELYDLLVRNETLHNGKKWNRIMFRRSGEFSSTPDLVVETEIRPASKTFILITRSIERIFGSS